MIPETKITGRKEGKRSEGGRRQGEREEKGLKSEIRGKRKNVHRGWGKVHINVLSYQRINQHEEKGII